MYAIHRAQPGQDRQQQLDAHRLTGRLRRQSSQAEKSGGGDERAERDHREQPRRTVMAVVMVGPVAVVAAVAAVQIAPVGIAAAELMP